jgi:hypothetical protein
MARSRTRDLRRRVYQVLEQGPVGDSVGTWVDRALVALIVINLIAGARVDAAICDALCDGI